MERISRHLTYANVTATLALFVGLGGGAFAVARIPARDGTIHGCYSKRSGALRVVSGTRCRRAERRLAWNQRARIAPGTYLTPAVADARYLAAGGTAPNSERLGGVEPSGFYPAGSTVANADRLWGLAPDAFVQGSGVTTWLYSPYLYFSLADVTTVAAITHPHTSGLPQALVKAKQGGTAAIGMILDRPASLFGRALAVQRLNYCVESSGSPAKVDLVTITRNDGTDVTTEYNDFTDRTNTSFQCFDVTPPSPIATSDELEFGVTVSFSALNQTIALSRVSAVLVPA
jgi:hypothetical protein